MAERIPQSTTIRVAFQAFLTVDGSAATGKTIAITISKNGAAFGNPNAGATNATEIASGWYYVDLDTTDTGTLGPLLVRGAVSGIDDVGEQFRVVKATNGGFTALPDAAAGAVNGLPILAGKLLNYFRLLVRKDSAIATDAATELTELNANGGSGAGSFDNTTDSEQAIRDNMATVSSGYVSADIKKIDGSATAATNLKGGALSVNPGSAVTGTLTTTQFTTDLAGTDDSDYVLGVLTFTGDTTTTALRGVRVKVTGYNGSTKAITVAPALPVAPANGDTFTIA